MKRLLSIALISVGLSSVVSADTFNLHPGWNLLGSSSSVDLSKDFNNSNISIIWRYENGQWQYYTNNDIVKNKLSNKYTLFTKTSPNEGFWVYANSYADINTSNNIQGIQTLKEFKETLNKYNVKPLDYNISNKTFLTTTDQGHMVYYVDNNLNVYEYTTEGWRDLARINKGIVEKLSNIDNIYIDKKNDKFFAIVGKYGNGNIIKVLEEDINNNGEVKEDGALAVNGNIVNTKITSVNNLLSLLKIKPIDINESEIEGKWKSGKNELIINNGILKDNNNGQVSYTIENNVLVEHYGNANLYMIPISKVNNEVTVVSVLVATSDNFVRGASFHIYKKQ